jgi:hypothetical protein
LLQRRWLQHFKKDDVLKSVNANRLIVGGDPITILTSINLKSNITPPAVLASKENVNITVFEQGIKNVNVVTSNEYVDEILNKDKILRALVGSIHQDINLLRAFSTQKLVDMGIEMLDDSGACPLCDREWKPGELRTYLEKKTASAKIVKGQIEQIEKAAQLLLEKISIILINLEKVIHITSILSMEKELTVLNDWQANLKYLKSLLEDPLHKYHSPKFTPKQVSKLLAPESVQEMMNNVLEIAKKKFPESTPEQTAWDILTELGVELKQLEDWEKELELTEISYKRASLLQTEFEKARDEILAKLYEEIKDRFVELYRELHREDEKEFNASLRPSGAALDFEVDFSERHTPPHALHSEGHQDSMGLCLFLALSEKLT